MAELSHFPLERLKGFLLTSKGLAIVRNSYVSVPPPLFSSDQGAVVLQFETIFPFVQRFGFFADKNLMFSIYALYRC